MRVSALFTTHTHHICDPEEFRLGITLDSSCVFLACSRTLIPGVDYSLRPFIMFNVNAGSHGGIRG